ncbi:MAG: AMIN domain-containing protein [Acidobacteria bacterium]|nr:AMIN domain-containing protein [Acidobacteriota bacterium]
MLRLNLLKSASPPAARGAFSTRREVWMGAVLLVAGGALLFYLASQRTVVLAPAPAAPKKSEAIPPPPQPGPEAQTPPAPVGTPKTGPPAAAPKVEPAPSPTAKKTAPAPPTKTEPPAAVAKAQALAGPGAPFQLTEVSIQQQKDALILLARIGPGDWKYQTMRLDNPNRLVVDLSNCRLAVPSSLYSRTVEHPKVKRVRMSQFRLDPPLTRIVLDVAEFPRYQIRPDTQGLEIKVLDGQP